MSDLENSFSGEFTRRSECAHRRGSDGRIDPVNGLVGKTAWSDRLLAAEPALGFAYRARCAQPELCLVGQSANQFYNDAAVPLFGKAPPRRLRRTG